MTEYSHIIDDGYLHELDIKVSKDCKIKTRPGLMAMELPSSVDSDFTVEDVVESLKKAAKASAKQYEDHCAKFGIDPKRHV